MGTVRINNRYYRCPEYIDFKKQRISLVLEFVIAHVVRKGGGGRTYIYKNHYLEHELVARFSQEDIAEYLGTQQSHVSEYLSRLESMKLLRKIERQAYNTRLLYYKVGTWSGDAGKDSYSETLYMDMLFEPLSRIAIEERMRKKTFMSAESIRAEIEALNTEDAWYEDDLDYWNRQLERAVSREGMPQHPVDGYRASK